MTNNSLKEEKCTPHVTDLLGECYKCGETPDYSVSSPTWEVREREAWRNVDSDFPDFIRYADSIADYWIARMSAIREEGR